jgi:CheY-like chemotaxis protein
LLRSIFDMFVQVDSTLDRAHGGMGIGLTLCKSLIELHGGVIEARSEGDGQGSEFIIRLPCAPVSPRRLEDRVSPERQTTKLARLRVLVVDDVVASADTLALMLAKLGQTVVTVHDGAAALAAVQGALPDVAFLDIAMPGMDGYELARNLRQREDCKEAVLVALTGYGQEEDRRRAFAAGFDHHFVKPISMQALEGLLIATQRQRRVPSPA